MGRRGSTTLNPCITYDRPYIQLLALIQSDLSNKHLDMLNPFKHFKGITEDKTRLSFPKQIATAGHWL